MPRKIALVQGHPDPSPNHYCQALAAAYIEGARAAGHEVRVIDVARLNFALIRTAEEFRDPVLPPDIQVAQDVIGWADHLVIVYPLWLGTLPALLKGFLEQVFREGFAMRFAPDGKGWKRLLKHKSARIIVTMAMPAAIYRWFFGAHGLKSLERSILRFAGIGPIRESLIGMIAIQDSQQRGRWLNRVQELGRKGR